MFRNYIIFLLIFLAMPLAVLGQQEVWMGYGLNSTKRTALGYETNETYDMAAYYRGSQFEGLTVDAVRIYLRSTSCYQDVKVWLSTQLPSAHDVSDADVAVIPIDLSLATGGDEGDYAVGMPNVITLPVPYTITAQGVYIGYSLTVTDTAPVAGQQPMVRYMDSRDDDGFFFRTNLNMTTWTRTMEAFGNLALELLVAGDFPACAATPSDFGDSFAQIGTETHASVRVTNLGTSAIESLSYSLSCRGEEIACQTLQVNGLQSYQSSATFDLVIPADDHASEETLTLTITEVNGQPNVADRTTAQGRLATYVEPYPRRIVVEECTGTGCMWCPRGHQGMHDLRAALGDAFVGIAIHQFNNSDPMYIDEGNYYPHAFSGAPMCRINRHEELDPFYGSLWSMEHRISEDVLPYLSQNATVGVEVEGIWSADRSHVEAKATVQSLISRRSLDIEYVLVADDLHSRTRKWRQSNGYYSHSAKDEPAELAPYCKGGEMGSSAITDLHYMDVCLSSSFSNYLNEAYSLFLFSASEPYEHTHTLRMTYSTDVLSVLDYSQVYVIAIVTDPATGYVLNAAKTRVLQPGETALVDLPDDSLNEAVYYSLDGRRLEAPQPGLNLRVMTSRRGIIWY